MNLGSLLPRHARYRPDHLALVIDGHRLTWRALDARVNRLANALLGEGLRKGDKVATMAQNSADFVIGFYEITPTFKTSGDGTTRGFTRKPYASSTSTVPVIARCPRSRPSNQAAFAARMSPSEHIASKSACPSPPV